MLFDRFTVVRLVFFFLFCVSGLNKGISAEFTTITEIPPIKNYSSKDYKGANKVLQLVQDQNQVIYASTHNSIIIFDGSFWYNVNVRGLPKLSMINNELYVGLYNDFGKIEFSHSGYSYRSLLENVDFNDGQIEGIVASSNKLYFTTANQIYTYENGQVDLFESFGSNVKLLFTGKRTYLNVNDEGLYIIENDSLYLANGGQFFKQKTILNIIDFDEFEYIITRQNGIYYYDDNLFYVLPESRTLLQKNDICCATKLIDNIVLGTEKKGILILNSNGYLIESYPFESGVYSSEINNIYADINNDLWLSTNYGISFLERSANYTYFNENNGIQGEIADVYTIKKDVFIGTSQCLYKYNVENKELIAYRDLHHVYDIFTFKGDLFCSTEEGVFIYKLNQWESFYDSEWLIAQESGFHEDVIYVASKDGFFIYKTLGNHLYRLFSLSSITKDINSIVEGQSNIWVGTNYNGLFKIEYKNTLDSILEIQQVQTILDKPTSWIKVETLKNHPVFITKTGLYNYFSSQNKFVEDTLISPLIKKDYTYINQVSSNDSVIWFVMSNDLEYSSIIGFTYFDSTEQLKRPYYLKRLENNKIRKFTFANNKTWVLTEKELLLFKNVDIDKSYSTQTFVSKITADGISFYLKPKSTSVEIPRNTNSIRFNLSTPYHAESNVIHYRYKLKDFGDEWSKWTTLREIDYKNIPGGNYTLQIESKDLNDKILSRYKLSFTIYPPYFKSLLAYVIYILLLISFVVLIIKSRSYLFALEKYRLENTINTRTRELIYQREKTEELLKNYAPRETIESLHEYRKEKAQRYKMVTILFADIMGFKEITTQEQSSEIIDELDKYYFQFDQVVEQHHIKKIKTVGDTYMCAGGIPKKNRTNPIEVVLAAFEMQQYLQHLRNSNRFKEIKLWDVRFGIHTGPVFAEENPRKKHPFDIWGETVNVASRMQSSGDIGKVNISGSTYELIREYFICQYRGKMPVKYKGDLDMYYIEGFRPKLSIDEKGILPNNAFNTKLALIRYDDLEEFVLNKMETDLPESMYYHNLKHTIDVIVQVELIGRSEGISDDELLLLKTAALFHDFGFTIGYKNHEDLGIKLARGILPLYDYSPEQIQRIEELIYVTKLPPTPKDKIEEIMCDADLDYLGRVDFIPVSQMLFRELVENGKIEDDINSFNKIQINFIENHQYFTETAKSLRDVNKKKQLENIRKLVDSEKIT